MRKLLGIAILLVLVGAATELISGGRFLMPGNLENLIRRSALFGMLSIGAAFPIVTGGIDLSAGSIVCLAGCLVPWLLVEQGFTVPGALALALGLSAALGAAHGVFVTRLRLQPFVVTLCGLLIYRGAARGLTGDQTQGFGVRFESLRWLASGRLTITDDFALPAPVVILAVIAVAATLFLDRTVWGRYLLAIGRNEEAARLSGIRTGRMVVLAYAISGLLAGVGGLLFVLDVNSAQASDFGNFYELYAIAGAVLGGCALRGGEGSVAGVLLGATLMQTLRNAIRLSDLVPDQLEFAVIGVVILCGVSADELVKRWLERRGAH